VDAVSARRRGRRPAIPSRPPSHDPALSASRGAAEPPPPYGRKTVGHRPRSVCLATPPIRPGCGVMYRRSVERKFSNAKAGASGVDVDEELHRFVTQ
jgi:hypothetical protein